MSESSVVVEVLRRKDGVSSSAEGARDHHGAPEVSGLPIPLINGQAADVDEMTVDQLCKFINLAYYCFYQTKLPSIGNCKAVNPPSWWPKSKIKFNYALELHPNCFKAWHRKYLVELLLDFYDFCGYASLLIAAPSNSSDTSISIQGEESESNDILDITDYPGKTDMWDAGVSQTLIRSARIAQDVRQQRGEVDKKLDGDDRSNLATLSSSSKRKPQAKTRKKNICQKGVAEKSTVTKIKFNLHPPSECDATPKESFLCMLGLRTRGFEDNKPTHFLPTTSSSFTFPPTTATEGGRKLRKLPSRNPILPVIEKNPFLPISSGPGQILLSKHDKRHSKMEHTYPPSYESYCKTVISRRLQPPTSTIAEGDYPVNTANKIIQDGINAHIYSYGKGKLQRTKRYQELVMGLNRRSWPALKKCKKARLQLQKIHPLTKRISIRSNVTKKSYLMRAFRGAIEFPRIKLVDCKKLDINKRNLEGARARVQLVDFMKNSSVSASDYSL